MRGGKKNYKGGGYKKYRAYNDYDFKYQNDKEQIRDVTTVTKAIEEGFTGPKQTWFNDEEFFKDLPGNSDHLGKKDYYFNSYSSFYIHEDMIKDRVRTGAYLDAIQKNAGVFKDKIVLDIGCGTGILSIFASRAGAKHVYGIEFADIADYAKDIVKKNNLSDKITIIQSKVEETILPVDKVDIIISEWMGYFLLYESMLDTVLFARDKWLDADGYMFPDRASIYLSAIEDEDYKRKKLQFWDDVYGISMKCMKPQVLADPLIEKCPEEGINTSVCKIFEIDLYTVTKAELDFASKYELTFFRNDYCHGLVGWFDCVFSKVPNKITLTTSPHSKTTHWKQVVFYTETNFKVSKGQVLSGSIAVRKSLANFRQLDIKISYHVDENLHWTQLYKIA